MMTTRNIVVVAAMAVAALLRPAGYAHADSLNIYQATLAEADQKTQEVSTEQLRRILADGSAIVLDTRTRAEFDAGHIPGARNLDAPASAQVAAIERMVDGDKSKHSCCTAMAPIARPVGARLSSWSPPASRMCGVTSSAFRSGVH
jgi:hypothetical protein